MKALKYLSLLLACLLLTTLMVAQTAQRGPISTTVVGHMAVTLMTSAKFISNPDMLLKNMAVNKAGISMIDQSSKSDFQQSNLSLASFKVTGNTTYDVNVNESQYSFTHKGQQISVGNFSCRSNLRSLDDGLIYIGATTSIRKRNEVCLALNEAPLTVTINYN